MRSIISLMFLATLSTSSFSQVLDIDQFENCLSPHEHEKQYHVSQIAQSDNEIQMSFAILFNGYKNFISSQDQVSCNFTPSCSEYGFLAVKKYGAIKGMTLTFDRLTRCHGLSPEHYETSPKTGLFLDHP